MWVRRKTVERLLADQQRNFEREREAFRRERADLIDRIMYMADRPWTPPPAELRAEPPPEPIEWPTLPEQLMVDEVDVVGG